MKIFRLIIICLFLTGCAAGNCRHQKKLATAKAGKTSSIKDATGLVYVYKYDGSLQCGMGKPIAMKKMKKDLGEIKIYSSKKKNDGLMRVQVCGAATGEANLYEISNKDLPKAQSKGFKSWRFN